SVEVAGGDVEVEGSDVDALNLGGYGELHAVAADDVLVGVAEQDEAFGRAGRRHGIFVGVYAEQRPAGGFDLRDGAEEGGYLEVADRAPRPAKEGHDDGAESEAVGEA